MRQARRYLYLAAEAISAECGDEVLVEDLDGNLSLMTYVARKKDGCHPALPQLALYIITITQACPEFFEKL